MSLRYQIVKSFVQDSFKSVLLVEDQVTSKCYIMKSIQKNCDSIYKHQFHVEVDILSRLQSHYAPYLVNVIETSTEFQLIESYIEGMSLQEWLIYHSKHNRLRKKFIFECLERIKMIHDLNYLYIDVKPENFVVYNNSLFLIDFNSCIEMGSCQAYFASTSNQAKELTQSIPKTIESDIYAIGSFIQKVYPKIGLRPIIHKCLRENSKKRFHSIQSLKSSLKLYFVIKKISIIILFIGFCLNPILSSFQSKSILSQYLDSRDPTQCINAYQYTLNQQSGSYLERIQFNLYQWIENGWITNIECEQREVADYFLSQALVSKNPIYVKTILDYSKQTYEEYHSQTMLLAQCYVSDIYLDDRWLSEYMKSIFKNHQIDQMFQQLDCLFQVLIYKEIELDYENQKLLEDKINSISLEDLNENKEFSSRIGFDFLEYCLFLSSKQNSKMSISSSWKEFFKEDETWNELYQMWRTSI